jgi:hypothetical protein
MCSARTSARFILGRPQVLIGLALIGLLTSGCAPRKTPAPAIDPAPTVDAECTDEGRTMMLAVVFDNNPFDPRLRTAWGFAA